MIKIFKIIIVCILCIISLGILYIIGVLIYASITEFKPADVGRLNTSGSSGQKLSDSTKKITMITWNIGYAGLGKEMDFFYEEGKMVRPTKELNKKYFAGIAEFIFENNDIDFFLFQEMDLDSKRSFHFNQYESICNLLRNHTSVFANNYKASYIPIPFNKPMGKVNSGMATFSKFTPFESKRISTPGSHAWPKRLFMLKRCLISSRFKLENGKSLVLINLHNSAFGDEDELRKQELDLLKNLLLEEYDNGNYVIAGGDWNQNPPTMVEFNYDNYLGMKNWPIEEDYLPHDWQWVFDPSLPTNRSVKEPFRKEFTQTTLLDFFVISPNIEVLDVKTIDLEFESADHLPVKMRVLLK
jgi:endonuclease/exonuclease/phosphatase family metal-dependent hydrolase